PAHTRVDFVSGVAPLLEQVFRANVEGLRFWPIEEPGEPVCFREQDFGIPRSVRVLEEIGDWRSRVRCPRHIEPKVFARSHSEKEKNGEDGKQECYPAD